MSEQRFQTEDALIAESRDRPNQQARTLNRSDPSMDDTARATIDSEELRLRELITVLWRGRRLIAWITLGFIVVATVGAFLTPKTYEASVTMSPVSRNDGLLNGGGSMGGLGSELGGIAAIAGLSVGVDSRKWESISVLESAALTEQYIRENNLLPELFHRDWDAAHRRWKDSSPRTIPTLWKANRLFKGKVRSVETDAKTGLITLKISWRNPVLAANWANGLVAMTNDYLRDKAIAEDENNIAYLQAQADKSNEVNLKQAIYEVLVEEVKREMFARGTHEFAFKVLDPAEVPEKAASPKKTLWVLVGAFCGLILSSLIVLGRFSAR